MFITLSSPDEQEGEKSDKTLMAHILSPYGFSFFTSELPYSFKPFEQLLFNDKIYVYSICAFNIRVPDTSNYPTFTLSSHGIIFKSIWRPSIRNNLRIPNTLSVSKYRPIEHKLGRGVQVLHKVKWDQKPKMEEPKI